MHVTLDSMKKLCLQIRNEFDIYENKNFDKGYLSYKERHNEWVKFIDNKFSKNFISIEVHKMCYENFLSLDKRKKRLKQPKRK